MRIENPVWQFCPDLKRLFEILENNIRFIGGCVRDSLIQKPVHDIDLATSYEPDEVLKILQNKGFKVLPTGIQHGTVTVVLSDSCFKAIEITSLRRDIRTDGRHAEVVYTTDWAIDAMRRDFTVNALSADFDGTVYDYCGGFEDLKNRIVRFIGTPDDRIKEDYLRVLRYFRFLASFSEHEADKITLQSCKEAAPYLSRLSLERVKHEMFRLLESENPMRGLSAMAETEILVKYFLYADLSGFEKFLQAEPKSSLFLRLLALTPLTSEGIQELIDKWQLSKRDKRQMDFIVNFSKAKNPTAYTSNDIFRFAVYFKDNNPTEILSLFDTAEPNRGWADLKQQVLKLNLPDFPFSGKYIIGNVPKNKIGEVIKEVHEYWLSENGTPGHQELLDYFNNHVLPAYSRLQSGYTALQMSD